MYLHEIENYTEYLNDLIDQDRLKKRDPKVIDAKIKVKQMEIKELQDLKKQGSQLENYEDIISEFYHDLEKPQTYDPLSRNICFKYFKKKYWPRINKIPEYKLKNPVDVFNEIMEEK